MKADGCDILPGLGESVNGVRSGDLERQYTAYKEYLKSIQSIQMAESSNHITLLEQLKQVCTKLRDDLNFLHSGKSYS